MERFSGAGPGLIGAGFSTLLGGFRQPESGIGRESRNSRVAKATGLPTGFEAGFSKNASAGFDYVLLRVAYQGVMGYAAEIYANQPVVGVSAGTFQPEGVVFQHPVGSGFFGVRQKPFRNDFRFEMPYISADHIHVEAMGLYEIGSSFFRLGGNTIVIDEVHKYATWRQEVKNLYDAFPDAKIYFSGSSTLGLQKGKDDLSRRAIYYVLPGLSFREYLNFTHGFSFGPISLPDLIENHPVIAFRILEKGPVLGRFSQYLDHGVSPFFLEGVYVYHDKLSNVIEKVLYEDIPAATATKTTNVPVLKRILWLIATSQPFSPNIEKMAREMKIS